MEKCKDLIQEKLDKATPIVGVYIVAASAACTLAMAADTINGFRSKKLWFPSKFFALNAITLTLLAVAMKLPLDFNTNMYNSATDLLPSKYISILFMSTAMANFMASLGTMTDKEALANTAALAILVITVSANVLTQLFLLSFDLGNSSVAILMAPTVLMLRLLVKLVSLSFMVPTIKRRMEAKYQEMHKLVLREQDTLNRRGAFVINGTKRHMMKYWIMAETSSPQFVMARSVVCTTSVCFMNALLLVTAYVYMFCFVGRHVRVPQSSYKASTILILAIQSIGVAVGGVAPTLRWFAAVSFKCSTATNWKSFKETFKIESYWTQIFVECRDSLSSSRKFVHDAKWFAVTFCIGLQIFTLYLSKLFVVFSVLLTLPFFLCFIVVNKIVNRRSIKVEASVDDVNPNLNRYVLLLEGEAELPMRVLTNMCHDANNMIRMGRKKQPLPLVRLLRKSVNFNGVAQFDSDRIPSLHSQEPPNCWTLPVVTLTSIAVALPNVHKNRVMQLMNSVNEGLSLAKLVDEIYDENAQLTNITKAADICWAGVLLYKKWQGVDLTRTSLGCKNSKEVLRELSTKAEATITKFKKDVNDPIMKNPLNWPAKVVAANSMYRITQTVLFSHEVEEENEVLFERLCAMVADILAACLTNLPHVITTMCHRNAIEKREKSVRKAFRLLGETEQVIELLQQREWPDMDHAQAALVEEWRANLFIQNDDRPATLTSNGECLAIRVGF